MNTKEKAVSGGDHSGFNQNLVAGGKLKHFDVFNSKPKSILKQRLCACGAAIPIDAAIFDRAKLCLDCEAATAVIELSILTITRTVRKATKAFFCSTCRGHFQPSRMALLNTCRGCIKDAQAKPDRERRRFASSILANMHKSLRGLLAL